MHRQLVRHGASTLMVSLPKKWVDAQRLRKGDVVDVKPIDAKIVITKTGTQKRTSAVEVRLSAPDYESARSLLGTLYRQGHERITVTYADPKAIIPIQTICRAIQGFEIIEQDERHCVIRNIVRELTIDPAELRMKVVNSIKAEFLMVRDYLQNGEKRRIGDLQSIRDECWKMRNLLYVHLRDNPLFSAHDEYVIMHLLEYNASFLLWLYRSFDKSHGAKASPAFLRLYDEVAEYFSGTMKRMVAKDPRLVQYVMNERDALLRQCEEYALSNARDRHLVIYLAMLIQNIHNPKSLIA